MQIREFLERIWPDRGLYCIVGIHDGGRLQHIYSDSIEQAAVDAQGLLDDYVDVYFAVSTYKNKIDGRKQHNASEQKALWLDIDCGVHHKNKKLKDYATKEDAIAAVGEFCTKVGLPNPMIVHSGYGIHTYWVFEEPVPTEVWKPIAEGLKYLTLKHGLKADPACTADAARVLRVPGTYNYKNREMPSPVTVIMKGTVTPFTDLAALIPAQLVPAPTPAAQKRPLDPVTASILNSYSANFRKIVKRCVEGDGCPQITHIIKNQATISEPLWRSGLSIAGFCDDRDEAIHKMSRLHPEYSHAATEHKVSLIPAPHKCVEFEKHNPGGCDSCTHKGKINTPISLGKVVLKTGNGENRVIAKSEELGEDQEYVIPPYPYPYFRGKSGGIFKALPDDEDDGVLVYKYDFYLVDRLIDPDPSIGECVWYRLHLPHDGVREFIAPTANILAKEKAREILISKGVLAYGKQLDMIMDYIAFTTQHCQDTKMGAPVYKKYGWNETHSSILIGNREISPFGVNYVPVANVLTNVNKTLHKQGSYQVWKDTINIYARPGMELRAFGFFCGFGSLLMPFLEYASAAINLYNPESGQGKSSILKAMTSIYGNPKENANLMLMYGDTMNSIINRLGYMGNLPQAIDEMTDPDPEDIQMLLKHITGKRGKNRMINGANGERMNDTTFELIAVASSNTDWRKVMFSYKAIGSGEINRFIQLKIEQDNTLSKAQATEIFSKLHHNYGHAGEEYARYLVSNLDQVKKLVSNLQNKIDEDFKTVGKERFYSSTYAAVFAGAFIAKQLNIHDIPIGPVYNAIKKEFLAAREDLKERDFNAVNALTDYINSHLRDILVINGIADKRTGVEQAPIIRPMNSLRARIEPDTEMMFIPVSSLKEYCMKVKVDHSDFILGLKRAGIYIKSETKNVNKGLGIAAAGTRCVWVSIRGIEALQPENLDLDRVADDNKRDPL